MSHLKYDTLPVDFQVVMLTWWAVFRDSFYYILSVLALIAVSWAIYKFTTSLCK